MIFCLFPSATQKACVEVCVGGLAGHEIYLFDDPNHPLGDALPGIHYRTTPCNRLGQITGLESIRGLLECLLSVDCDEQSPIAKIDPATLLFGTSPFREISDGRADMMGFETTRFGSMSGMLYCLNKRFIREALQTLASRSFPIQEEYRDDSFIARLAYLLLGKRAIIHPFDNGRYIENLANDTLPEVMRVLDKVASQPTFTAAQGLTPQSLRALMDAHRASRQRAAGSNSTSVDLAPASRVALAQLAYNEPYLGFWLEAFPDARTKLLPGHRVDCYCFCERKLPVDGVTFVTSKPRVNLWQHIQRDRYEIIYEYLEAEGLLEQFDYIAYLDCDTTLLSPLLEPGNYVLVTDKAFCQGSFMMATRELWRQIYDTSRNYAFPSNNDYYENGGADEQILTLALANVEACVRLPVHGTVRFLSGDIHEEHKSTGEMYCHHVWGRDRVNIDYAAGKIERFVGLYEIECAAIAPENGSDRLYQVRWADGRVEYLDREKRCFFAEHPCSESGPPTS